MGGGSRKRCTDGQASAWTGGPPTGAVGDTCGACLGAAPLSARHSWSSRETREDKEDAARLFPSFSHLVSMPSTLSTSRFLVNTWESVFFNAYFCFSGINCVFANVKKSFG